jgi:mannose-6-phosphate isomerase
MNGRQSMYELKGVVQHYSWGGFHFIPQLLGQENKGQKPFAEYWLGAHPNHPSSIILNREEKKLNEFISETNIPQLPYLLKVLDVRQMLSIQVHPDKASAEKGFDEENESGIAVNAPNRNYKDKNHKPELMVALSDFWLLHGFKKVDELKETLDKAEELSGLKASFGNEDYKGLYEKVMTMPQEDVNRTLKPLLNKIVPLYKENKLRKSDPHFWSARAYETFCKGEDIDRGLFSIYFFNLLNLKEGEGIYQPAGMPHAYLEGQNVEIMANSDNVLRAGLTDKHVDITELMKHIRFEATAPEILKPKADEIRFSPPVREFELYRHKILSPVEIETSANEIWLLIEGGINIKGQKQEKGSAVYFLFDETIFIEPLQPAVLFRARVPQGGKN